MKPKRILARWISLFVLTAALVVSASGCAKEAEKSNNGGWEQFPVPLYSDSSLALSNAAQTDLADAMAFWEASAGRKLFDYRGQWGGQFPPYSGSASAPGKILANVIMLQNPWPFGQNIVGQTTTRSSDNVIESSVIMINGSTNFCSGECLYQNGVSLRRTIAHELGHFLGLGHSDDKNNIMYPQIQPGSSLTNLQVDVTALSAIVP